MMTLLGFAATLILGPVLMNRMFVWTGLAGPPSPKMRNGRVPQVGRLCGYDR
jgi:hypothetical protein